jgi:hypothetical protein
MRCRSPFLLVSSVTLFSRMIGTVAAVFVSFLLRLGFIAFNAYTYIGVSPLNAKCLINEECAECGMLHVWHRSFDTTAANTSCRCLPVPSAVDVLVERLYAAV